MGTTFSLPFVVFDRSVPPLSATVTRFVTIANPCGSDYLCGTECSKVDCDTKANLESLPGGDEAAARKVPPVLVLWPDRYNASAAADEASELGVYGLGAGVTSPPTQYLVFGEVAALSLEPCESLAVNASCAAVANDTQNGDLTDRITVRVLFIFASQPPAARSRRRAHPAGRLCSSHVRSPHSRLITPPSLPPCPPSHRR